MITRLRLPWLTLVMLALVGCSSRDGGSGAPDPGAGNGARARVVTLSMTVETEDARATADALRRWVEREEGYVETASWSDGGATELLLRVPTARLPAFRRAARRLGDITDEHERVEDVGDRRADLDARLRSARRSEETLLALMGDRSAALGDVLLVEQRLAEARERIERLDAERAALQQRVDYAAVTVHVVPPSVAFWDRPWETVASAGAWGVELASAILVGAAAVLAAIGPSGVMLALSLAALAGALRLLFRRRRTAAA